MDHITFVNKSYLHWRAREMSEIVQNIFIFWIKLLYICHLGDIFGLEKINLFCLSSYTRSLYHEVYFIFSFRRKMMAEPLTSGCRSGASSSPLYDL